MKIKTHRDTQYLADSVRAQWMKQQKSKYKYKLFIYSPSLAMKSEKHIYKHGLF